MEYVDKQHLTKTPGVCGGRACIAGHSIRVMDIVGWHEMRGMSTREIVAEFPGIGVWRYNDGPGWQQLLPLLELLPRLL